MNRPLKAGVISDTHGLARSEALAALRGVDCIIHAGDIGSTTVIDELCRIAPVTAIRGNVDSAGWAHAFPATAVVVLGDTTVYVIHNIHELDLDPRTAGFAVVISGHSHHPFQEWRDGVLYFNPGSAGPRRFLLPVSLGLLTVGGATITGEIVTLAV